MMKRGILAWLAITLLLVYVAGCAQMQDRTEWKQTEWQLQGAWVQEDGNVSEKIPISFSGKMPAKPCLDHSVHSTEVHIVFPADFQYREEPCEEVSVICVAGDDTVEHFYCNGFSSKSDSTSAVRKVFFVFPAQEVIIFVWPESEGSYFVASTDPDADPAGILELYGEYVRDPVV